MKACSESVSPMMLRRRKSGSAARSFGLTRSNALDGAVVGEQPAAEAERAGCSRPSPCRPSRGARGRGAPRSRACRRAPASESAAGARRWAACRGGRSRRRSGRSRTRRGAGRRPRATTWDSSRVTWQRSRFGSLWRIATSAPMASVPSSGSGWRARSPRHPNSNNGRRRGGHPVPERPLRREPRRLTASRGPPIGCRNPAKPLVEPSMSDDIAVGIDLGTSYSAVAAVTGPGGAPQVLPNEWGERTHASVVSLPRRRHGPRRQRRQEEHHHQRREHRLLGEAAHRPLLLLRRGEEGAGGDAVPDRRGAEQLGAHPGAGQGASPSRRSPRSSSRR